MLLVTTDYFFQLSTHITCVLEAFLLQIQKFLGEKQITPLVMQSTVYKILHYKTNSFITSICNL